MSDLLDTIPGLLVDAWPTIALLLIAAVVALKAAPWLRRIGHLLDDLQGEKPRPGLPHGQPGLMQRVAHVEDLTSELGSNNGLSVKDQINRIDVRVENQERRTIRLEERLHTIEANTRGGN